jgi:hypothetical protein
LRSDILLEARSALMFETPVTLPAGRAKFVTKPVATGSPTMDMIIGICLVARMAARAPGVLIATMTSTRAFLHRERRKAIVLPFRGSNHEAQVPVFVIAKLAQGFE